MHPPANAGRNHFAQIVGYQNSGLNAYGQLKSASFVNITQKDGVRLSDISISGYQETEGACYGDISIVSLDTDGSSVFVEGIYKNYYWYDADGEYEAGWYDYDEQPLKDNQSVLGNADEITFDVGQGLWVMVENAAFAGCTINFNGEVYCPEINYPLIAYGQLLGNPRPVDVYLSQLSISGYEETEGACYGDISIVSLDTDGSSVFVEGIYKNYYWYDAEGEYEAGWYDYDEQPLKDGQSVLGNADEIKFVSGQGIWVMVENAAFAGCTFTFPALILNK